jgi:hypothetical protein
VHEPRQKLPHQTYRRKQVARPRIRRVVDPALANRFPILLASLPDDYVLTTRPKGFCRLDYCVCDLDGCEPKRRPDDSLIIDLAELGWSDQRIARHIVGLRNRRHRAGVQQLKVRYLASLPVLDDDQYGFIVDFANRLPASPANVLQVIAGEAFKYRTHQPLIPMFRLVSRTGLAETTVRRALAKLNTQGFVTTIRKQDNRYRSLRNAYLLHIELMSSYARTCARTHP